MPGRTASDRHPRLDAASEGPLRLDENLWCDTCGAFGAFDLGDRRLCEECYRGCGSCCLEFGGHDLWTDRE